MSWQEWDVTITVRVHDSHRRALAKRQGRRGLMTKEEFGDLVMDLVEEYSIEAFQTECDPPKRRLRSRPKEARRG